MNSSITLVVGDWSGDGHDKTENIFIKCNRSIDEVNEAYKAGTKIVGFDLVDSLCEEYEDRRIPIEAVTSLQDNGIEIDWDDEVDPDVGVNIYHEEFVEIYLAIVKLGDPDFKYERQSPPVINIGGYGLFY